MSIHADDEFSLRIALESELDDVLPGDGLADLVIARHRKIRRRRVAGAVGLVVVCAGIGAALGFAGPSAKPPQHNPGQRPDQRTGSITWIPHTRAGAALAGTVSLVVVCAGIGMRLGICEPSAKPLQHNAGQRPDQRTGSITWIPNARAEAALVTELPAPSRHRCGSRAEQRISMVKQHAAHAKTRDGRAACADGRSLDQRTMRSCQASHTPMPHRTGQSAIHFAVAAVAMPPA